MKRVLLLALLLLLAAAPAGAPAAAQDGEHRAGLIVRFGDGSVQTRCVAFSEPSITGQQLLQRSGFQVNINPNGAFGGAICSINNSGCTYPAQDCFCRCMGTQCEYWAYYHWTDGASASWQYSQTGAAAYQVKDGALDGWSWGPGNFSSGTEPPKIAFADVCKAGASATASAGAPPAPKPANAAQYAGFGVALIVLLAAAALILRRRAA